MFRNTLVWLLLAAFVLAACAAPAAPETPTDVPEPANPTVEQPTSRPAVTPTVQRPAATVTVDPDQPVSATPGEGEAGEGTPQPWEPKEGDQDMQRGNVFLDDAGLVILESYPIQVRLNLTGNLPTPCHELRAEIAEPNAENEIHIEVYSVVNPNIMCTQVLSPFDTSLPLGSFATGQYTVWVNGEQVGEFQA